MQTGLPKQNAISKSWYIIRALFILIFISFTTCLVYLTGGANYSFTHFMYAPIILSAYYFGTQGTVVAALLGGLALGPFMPQHVISGMIQPSASWIFRMAIFMLIGIMCSLIFKRIQHYKEAEIAGSYVNIMTGFPNIIKMKADLDELIYNKTEFSFIGFRVVNINSIKQNISYDIAI